MTTKTTRNGSPTRLPSFKVWAAAAGAAVMLFGVPMLNEFILSEANRIDLGAKELLLPFIPVLIAYIAPPSDKEGTT
jgi:hypothetical protein